jgi:hypothetical protein
VRKPETAGGIHAENNDFRAENGILPSLHHAVRTSGAQDLIEQVAKTNQPSQSTLKSIAAKGVVRNGG